MQTIELNGRKFEATKPRMLDLRIGEEVLLYPPNRDSNQALVIGKIKALDLEFPDEIELYVGGRSEPTTYAFLSQIRKEAAESGPITHPRCVTCGLYLLPNPE